MEDLEENAKKIADHYNDLIIDLITNYFINVKNFTEEELNKLDEDKLFKYVDTFCDILEKNEKFITNYDINKRIKLFKFLGFDHGNDYNEYLKDEKLKEILNDGKYYVILQLEITNRYREDHEFNYINLELTINNEYFLPNLSIANYFKDYGTPFNGTYIKGNTTSDYILVYEIDEFLINQSFMLTVYSHYDASVGGIGSVNNRIRLDPTLISDELTINNANIGTNINLANTNLGNSRFMITGYEFTNRHEYTYEYCITSSDCRQATNHIAIDYALDGTNTTLLVLDYSLSLDKEVPYLDIARTYRSIFEDYTKLTYQINGKTYYYDVSIANPSNYDEKAVIKVPRVMETADSIELILTIRNISYHIKLK